MVEQCMVQYCWMVQAEKGRPVKAAPACSASFELMGVTGRLLSVRGAFNCGESGSVDSVLCWLCLDHLGPERSGWPITDLGPACGLDSPASNIAELTEQGKALEGLEPSRQWGEQSQGSSATWYAG